MPVLDGVSQFLSGVRAMFAYRDFQLRASAGSNATDKERLVRWQTRLAKGRTLGEADALSLLKDFGIPVAESVAATSADEAASAATGIGYPVALKTTAAGILHKSDQGGVVLGIDNEDELRNVYEAMSGKLGNDVLVAAMAPNGIEMLLGIKRDPQFGPVVLLGFGGVLAETIGDIQFALPPFDAAHARRCVDRMKLRALLDGVRGEPPVAIDAFCEVAARFSEMAAALGDDVAEADVNPVVVHNNAAVAVDALVIGCDTKDDQHAET
jgi:succinyl-CoA synthetase beta subunit